MRKAVAAAAVILAACSLQSEWQLVAKARKGGRVRIELASDTIAPVWCNALYTDGTRYRAVQPGFDLILNVKDVTFIKIDWAVVNP